MYKMLQNQGLPLKKVLIIGASFLKCNTIYRLIEWSKYGFKAYMEPAGGMGLLKMIRIDPDVLILMDNLAWTESNRLMKNFNIQYSKSEILIITDNPSRFNNELYQGVQLMSSKDMNEHILVQALRNSGVLDYSHESIDRRQLLIGDQRQLRRLVDDSKSKKILLCRIESDEASSKDPKLLLGMEKVLNKEAPDKWFQEISGNYIICFEILEIGIIEQLKIINNLLLTIRKKAIKIFGNHINIYISDIITKENAVDAYAYLYEMRQYRFFVTGKEIISPNLIRQEFSDVPIDWNVLNGKYASLLEKTMCGKDEEAAIIIRSIFYDDIIKSGNQTICNQILFQLENILKCTAIILGASMSKSILPGRAFENIEDALAAELDLLKTIMQSRKETHKEYSPVITDTLLNICKHYNDPIYVGSLAQQVRVSESYLSRIFKQQTGMGISKCISYMRVYMAATDLIRNDLKVSDVAEAHGFYDSKYFSKTFHQIMGYTPSEWRNKYKGGFIDL